jgi:hypothetical protein
VRRLDEAIRAHEEAASIYRETGDRHGEGIALNNLGLAIPKVWPRTNEAIATLQRAAAIFQETGDRHAEGSTLNNLGQGLVKNAALQPSNCRVRACNGPL